MTGIRPHGYKDELVDAASTAGFSVLVDRPFAGALVPAKHYLPKVRAIMIESRSTSAGLDELLSHVTSNPRRPSRPKSRMDHVCPLAGLRVAQRLSQRSGFDSLDDTLLLGRCVVSALGHIERADAATALGVDPASELGTIKLKLPKLEL